VRADSGKGMRDHFKPAEQARFHARLASAGRGTLAGRSLKLAAAVAAGLAAANCSSQKVTSSGRAIDPKYGVAASPRVVEEGEPVPKGGGRELVGKAYQIAGRTYVPRESGSGYSRVGLASWYGSAFHGRLTANGEVFDRHSVAAAHPTLPLPSYARVTNLYNGHSMIVRVNDRGPYHANRLLDVSEQVAAALDFKRMGTARVRLDYLGRASIRGSDDRKLMATLRTDGSPAPFPGAARTMFAGLEQRAPAPPPRFAALEERDREEIAEERAPRGSGGSGPEAIRLASAAPLPPERPFDLGTIPNAATPVPVAALAPAPPIRPTVAGLFYAEPAGPRTRFAKADPFGNLRPRPFLPLKAAP
jgi:rare lipoprotein A